MAFAANLSTVAGNGTPGFSGDGALATDAEIESPRGLSVAANGTVFFSDLANARIRAVDAAGIIRTVAGNGTYDGFPGGGDGLLATDAQIGSVFSVAIDPTGTLLYVADADDNYIRVVNFNDGTINAFAGGPFNGIDGGAPGSAINAGLISPQGVAVDQATGNVFIADTGSCNVRKVDVSTAPPTISLLAGDPNCTAPVSQPADGSSASAARFFGVQRVAVDAAGNVFVLDAGRPGIGDPGNTTRRVYRIDQAGKIFTVAGGGINVPGFGPGPSMNIGHPADIAADGGALYIATLTQVFKVDETSGILSVFAGSGATGFSGDGTIATDASFTGLAGVAVRGDTVWLSEAGNARIRGVIPPPPVAPDVIVDALTTDAQLNAVIDAGNIVMVTIGGRTALVMKQLQTANGDVTVQGNNELLIVDLDELKSVGGTIDISGNLSMTSLDLTSLGTVGGSLNISNDPSLSAVVISGITSIGGNLTLIGTSASIINLGTLGTVGGNLNISDNASSTDINLGSLGTTGGDLTLDNNTAATVNLGSLDTVGGNLSLSGNATLGTVNLGTVSGVGGNLTVNADPTVTSVNLGSLGATGGNLDISSDPALTAVNLGGLATTGSNLTLAGDTALTAINLANLDVVGGNLNLTSDPAVTTIDLGSLGSVNNLTITGDTSLDAVNLGNLSTVGGDLVINNNATDATGVNLGSLNTVGGNLSLETNGSGAFNLGSGTTTIGGDLSLTTNGYGSVSGTTATGTTSITTVTFDATMHLQIAAASFASPTQFTLTHLDPAATAPESGTASDGSAATIDPIVGYAFNFTTPSLNTPASLSFDVNLAGLSSADQTELLDAVQAGNATIVTKGDAAGSTFTAFSVCTGSQQPTAGGCVQITKLDASGNPTTGTPSAIRFSNIVGHFSSWAVGVVTALVDQCPTPSTDLCVDQTGFTTAHTETIVRNAGEEFIGDYDFVAAAPGATIVVHNNGCSTGVVTVNGNDVVSGLDLATKGQCFSGDVALNVGTNHVHVDLGATGGTLGTAARKGHCGGHGGGGDNDGHGGGGDNDGHGGGGGGDNDGHGDGDQGGGDHDGNHGQGDDDDHEGCPEGHHHANHGHHYGWTHSHHHGHGHDNDADDCVPDTGEGEGEGATGGEGEGATGGEGEGATGGEGEGATGGEGEGATGGEGEGATGGEGEGATGGEGEGEGGGVTDLGCTITINVEAAQECSVSSSAANASGPTSGGGCASTGTPAAFGVLALGLLLRRRRR